jgi:hypothetical protein
MRVGACLLITLLKVMILRVYLLGIVLAVSQLAYGHSDFYREQDFGNVKVRIKTGFDYEEIKKAWIIGELSQKLCEQARYKRPIFIDFVHHYTSDCVPDYFLSYDDGTIVESWGDRQEKPIAEGNALVIRQVSRKFTPAITLKLLEYAIANQKRIKDEQKKLAYHKNYCQWSVQSIDTAQARAIAMGRISGEVQRILNTRIYRQEKDGKPKGEVSYYFQDNQYHLFCNDNTAKDSVLLRVDNVHQLKKLPYGKAIVFDSDSSFYAIEGVYAPQVSRRYIIENIGRHYQPIPVQLVGELKVAFPFGERLRMGKVKERIALYRFDKDELIQDLDALLDEKTP